MHFAFEEAAIPISAERLHDADVNVSVVIAKESLAVQVDERCECVEIVVEELLAQPGWKVGLGVKEKRSNIVLQSAFTPALVVNKIRHTVAQHDVARLKITIQEIITGSFEKEIGKVVKIVLEGAFVEGNAGQAEKIVFAIIQIPGNGLAIEAGDGVAQAVVQVAARFHLKAREDTDGFAIGFDDAGSDLFAGAILREKFEQRSVAKVLFEISAVIEIFCVNLRHGQAIAAKMFRELEKSGVFFAASIENANSAHALIREADDLAAGGAEVALQRLNPRGSGVEMLPKKLFENVYRHGFHSIALRDGSGRVVLA